MKFRHHVEGYQAAQKCVVPTGSGQQDHECRGKEKAPGNLGVLGRKVLFLPVEGGIPRRVDF